MKGKIESSDNVVTKLPRILPTATIPESSESLAEVATSIQPLEVGRLVVAEGGEESSKPKILQIRAGKVMEKNQRCWSGACFRRKDSTESQAEAI